MTLEVPQRIRQRLAAVIDDLKSAIGQVLPPLSRWY